MSFPPSKYSPEFFKPQKPANHTCCGGCGPEPEVKVIKKRGCFIRHRVGGIASLRVGGVARHRSC